MPSPLSPTPFDELKKIATPGPYRAVRDKRAAHSVRLCCTPGGICIAQMNEYVGDPVINAEIIARLLNFAHAGGIQALRDAQQALAHAIYRLKDDPLFSTSIALKRAEENLLSSIKTLDGGAS